MLFCASYQYSAENRDAVHARFRETGGPPPEGVTMVGRWHRADGNGGFFVAETEDAAALARWLQEWTDLVSFEVSPVLPDEAFGDVVG